MKTIAWDIDDVLNNLMHIWFDTAFKQERPESPLCYQDLLENPPDQILGLSRQEYLDSLDAFRLSGKYDRLEPAPQLLEWFRQYGSQYRHLALTAVPRKAADVSARWVFHHFGEWIRTFHFVPSPRQGEEIPCYDSDKGEYLRRVGMVDLLVDDSRENIHAAEGAGVRGIVFPQPWNNSQAGLDDINRILHDQ